MRFQYGRDKAGQPIFLTQEEFNAGMDKFQGRALDPSGAFQPPGSVEFRAL